MSTEKNYRYLHLASILRNQILSGYIQPGEYLPSEHQLCDQYGLSRTSVRKSLEALVGEELIVKKVGAGTMVDPNLVVPPEKSKTLHVLVTSPAYFVDNQGFNIIVEAFKERFPNIHVHLLPLPRDVNFIDAIRKNNELGMNPDIVLAYDSQLREIEDFSPFMNLPSSLDESMNQVYPRLVDGLRFGQGTKLAPITFSPVFLAYNPDLFESNQIEKPGLHWTRDDFLRVARQFTADTNGDGIVDQYGFCLSTNLSRWFVFPLQNGIVQADPPTYREIVEDTCSFMHDLLYRQKGALIYYDTKYSYLNHPFVNGKAAMTLATTYMLSGWSQENVRFVPQITPLPFGPKRSTLLITNFLLIPESSPNKELAAEFIKTALRPDVQHQLWTSSEFLSVQPAVNRQVMSEKQLEIMNITEETMNSNYYLHELFPDESVRDDFFFREMELFWMGVDTASSFARKWLRVLPKLGN